MKTKKTTKTALAKELGVSRSSLYYKPKKPPEDDALTSKIIAVMNEHPAYGHRRISIELQVNKKAIVRVMRKSGLKPKLRRGFRHMTPDDLGGPETQVINILKLLCLLHPNIVWAGDFTDFWFMDRFWYLATVIDVRTREIVGWHVANHHTTTLIIEAFKDAVRRTGTAPNYLHSDQGSEYVSGGYESLLTEHGTILSQSRKGCPWQNGYQESFYANFKLELGEAKQFTHIGELIEAIHGQIDYYNNRRIHLALKMSPIKFHILEEQKQTALAAV